LEKCTNLFKYLKCIIGLSKDNKLEKYDFKPTFSNKNANKKIISNKLIFFQILLLLFWFNHMFYRAKNLYTFKKK